MKTTHSREIEALKTEIEALKERMTSYEAKCGCGNAISATKYPD